MPKNEAISASIRKNSVTARNSATIEAMISTMARISDAIPWSRPMVGCGRIMPGP
jgi:hypothetical protein